jgi:hypothetical protein
MTLISIGREEAARLERLRIFAVTHPLYMPQVRALMRTLEGEKLHMKAMAEHSVELPLGYLVTFSIETGHPFGTCRHMSMSSSVPSMAPSAQTAWMVAQRLGFVVGVHRCDVWIEELERDNKKYSAVNLIQLLTAGSA